MTHGGRWLASGLAGVALLLASGAYAAQARQDMPAPAGGVPPGTARPGTAGPVFTPPPPIRPGTPISVLVFPFSYAGEPTMPPAGAPAGAPDPAAQLRQEIANYVTAAVKAGFLATPAYSVVTYHPTQSSLIQRARRDEILTAADVTSVVDPETGAVDLAKARNLAYKLGLQTILTGTFDLTEDPMTNTVEVTLNAELIDSTTGQRIRTAAVSGAAQGAEGVPPVVVRERAIQEAAQKLFPAMGIQLVAPAPPAPPAEKKSRGRSRRRAPAKKEKDDDDSARRQQEKAQRQARAADEAARKAEERARREAEATAREGEARAREEARKAAEAAARAEREQARAAEKARREAERQTARQAKAASKPVPASQVASAQPAPAQPAPAQPAPAQPGAATQPEAAAPAPPAAPAGVVTGVADPTGKPVPYGYALDAGKEIPERDRRGLRVPAWLGVAAFLTGISFLL